MVRGMGKVNKKKPWIRDMIERDVEYHKDISEAYLQGGKALGDITKPKKKKSKKKHKD